MDSVKLHANDTGSSVVQIYALLSSTENLKQHLRNNPKDKHSRLGFKKQTSKLKKFLNYIKNSTKQLALFKEKYAAHPDILKLIK